MTLLKLDNIYKTFEKGTVNANPVLQGLNLTVEKGDFISIIGGNGAGKSTLLNSIFGNVVIDEGDIILLGESIKNQDVVQRSKNISRVFQDTRLGTASQLTIEENMSIAQLRGKSRSFFKRAVKDEQRKLFKEKLAPLGLDLENRLTVDTQFLSGGQRQALTLVMATLVKPELLLLDEHTAALDPKTSEMVMSLTNRLVSEQNITTLMVTHNMQHAIEYGNRLIMLHRGKVVVDIKGEEKKQMSVTKLMALFQKNSGETIVSDELSLG